MICDLLFKAKENDDDAMLELIRIFQPLLRMYAYKLRYDDAYNDLVLFFIDLVKTSELCRLRNWTDPAAVSYINTSVTNFYIRKSQRIAREGKEVPFSELSQEQRYYVEKMMSEWDKTDIWSEFGMEELLNANELKVIYFIYIEGYTASEISRIWNKSRQAVNQLKRRALKKLKQTIKIAN